MADVLKSLTFLAKSKSLSFREKRMLDRAKALIVSEISEVMRLTAASVEERVNEALEKCFANKAKAAQREAARAATAPKPAAPKAVVAPPTPKAVVAPPKPVAAKPVTAKPVAAKAVAAKPVPSKPVPVKATATKATSRAAAKPARQARAS
jgi:cell division septation protein DedD